MFVQDPAPIEISTQTPRVAHPTVKRAGDETEILGVKPQRKTGTDT